MVLEEIISHALYEVTKKILEKDPVRSAIDKAIDELGKEIGWFELREIERNREQIFDNINLVDETTFIKIVTENSVSLETASKLYKKFSKKFNENIKEAALKEPKIFYPYVIREIKKIRELENVKTDIKEIIKILEKHAQKREVDFEFEKIIKHIKDLQKIPPTIQSVLKKGEPSEGGFFRTQPEWVDFEQGFIVRRKEVSYILNSLQNKKVQLVLGAPASGKSVILKNAGYKLANDGKKVHVVELKRHPQDEIKLFFENIPKIDDESTFIVDDAHLYLSYCERLAKEFKSGGKGNLIIGSRETRDITAEHPKEGAEYELLSELSKTCIHIQAEDVTEGMIRTFLEKQYHFKKDII